MPTIAFTKCSRTQSDLIDDGYDEDQIKDLPDLSAPGQHPEERARDTVDENMLGHGDVGATTPTRLITVTEHHVRMDYEGNGKAGALSRHDRRPAGRNPHTQRPTADHRGKPHSDGGDVADHHAASADWDARWPIW